MNKVENKRKAISARNRFEVFKRDSFRCQYCGKSSPDVVLHVDHIKPVSKGGDNSIMNLITSCQCCNLGKSDIEIDDDSAISKQKAQLDELNEKRIQLEMMIEWRSSLKSLVDDAVDELVSEINDCLVSRSVNETGLISLKKWLKKFGYTLLSESIEASSDSYLKFDNEGKSTDESSSKFFNMIPRIAAMKTKQDDNPDLARLYYARGILRNRVRYVSDYQAIDLLVEANNIYQDAEYFVELAKTASSWSEFKKELAIIINPDVAL
jgi:hypothetical protein